MSEATAPLTRLTDEEMLNDDARNPQDGSERRNKIAPGTIRRIFGYIFKYKVHVIVVVVCILVAAIAQAASSLFLQQLIDS